MTYNPSKKHNILLILLICLTVILTACSSSLPEEAMVELDNLFQDWSPENSDFKVISLQQAELSEFDKNFIDEYWCIVTDKPVFMFMQDNTHFTLIKTGLLWEANVIANPDVFLQAGCKNW